MQKNPSRRSVSARRRARAGPILLQVRDFCRSCLEDIPLLTRVASHVGLLALTVFTVAASGIQLENTNAETVIASSSSDTDPIVQPLDVDEPTDDTEVASPLPPFTNIPPRIRREVAQYTVQAGDTVSDIADQFQVSADSVLWANPKLEDNPDMLSIGQVLNIPPTTGVLYSVQSGDTVQKLADKFKGKRKVDVVVQDIVQSEFNQEHHDIQPPNYALTAGQFLMIPGGIKPYTQRVVASPGGPVPSSAARGTGRFGWPVSGHITQKFWTRHPGIDVGAPKGTPIYAADAGYVYFAAWDQERLSYGNMILINHGNGFITRYGHLSAFNVQVGDSVKKGQLIGRVGSTGNSTGPHLHFEIYRNGVRINPFLYLR